MPRLIVKAKKLNKRIVVPNALPDPTGIVGTVNENFIFKGEEVLIVPNPGLGKWYKDSDNHFYWGGALNILDENEGAAEFEMPDNVLLEQISITPVIKKKIERIINAFETGKADGNYATLVKLKDHNDPVTKTTIVQITYGRSQTTEFSHLKALIEDYIESNGMFSNELKPFLQAVGKKPSLATNDDFCNTLINAGKRDPIMHTCQEHLFETKYYQPAHNWFSQNGFTLPLSLLVIYDSRIHSGGILPFLRQRFNTPVPENGGNEKQWIKDYVDARHNWLANHSSKLLRNTVYRTECFKEQIKDNNWDLSKAVKAHGITIT